MRDFRKGASQDLGAGVFAPYQSIKETGAKRRWADQIGRGKNAPGMAPYRTECYATQSPLSTEAAGARGTGCRWRRRSHNSGAPVAPTRNLAMTSLIGQPLDQLDSP